MPKHLGRPKKKPSPNTERISIYLSPALVKALDELAAPHDRSRVAEIRRILSRYVDSQSGC